MDEVHRVEQYLVDATLYPQEAPEPLEETSLMLGEPTEAPKPELTIPLPKEFIKSVTEVRKHCTTKLPLLNPLVKKGYRIPKEEWAMLGAVR